MKKILMFVLVLALLSPVCVYAAEIQGKVDAYAAVMQGKQLPQGDPRAQLVNTPVVVTPDNKFYFVLNVPKEVFQSLMGQNVKVTGDLQPQYDSINASRVEAMKNNRWTVVWDTAKPYAFPR
jgi:hypothetical protein